MAGMAGPRERARSLVLSPCTHPLLPAPLSYPCWQPMDNSAFYIPGDVSKAAYAELEALPAACQSRTLPSCLLEVSQLWRSTTGL